MVNLNTLQSNNAKSARVRVGRGGKRGKTSGRGHKGQKQHGGHGIRPQLRDFIKKLPKRRGFGNNRARTVNDSKMPYTPVNLSDIEVRFNDGDVVNAQTLLESGLAVKKSGKILPVKILARGRLTKKVKFENVIMSEKAKQLADKL